RSSDLHRLIRALSSESQVKALPKDRLSRSWKQVIERGQVHVCASHHRDEGLLHWAFLSCVLGLLCLRRENVARDEPQVRRPFRQPPRSEEHTSELQSLRHLVCRLLLEKKNNRMNLILT